MKRLTEVISVIFFGMTANDLCVGGMYSIFCGN